MSHTIEGSLRLPRSRHRIHGEDLDVNEFFNAGQSAQTASTSGETERPVINIGNPFATRLPNSSSQYATTDTNTRRNSWLLDSGATVHIVNNLDFVVNSRPLSLDVGTADGGGSMQVLGAVTIKLPLISPDGERQTNLIMKECLFIPSSRCNLISLSRIAESELNLSGVWNRSQVTIEYGTGGERQVIGVADIQDKLPVLRLYREENPTKPKMEDLALNIDFKDPVWSWHSRLGHLSIEVMRHLPNNVDGLNLTKAQINAKRGAICPICAITKATVRIPRDPARRRATRPGEIMHADTWGPYPIEGAQGVRFALFLIDDYSRYTWVIFAPNKEGMSDRLILLLREVQNVHHFKLGTIRLDQEVARVERFRIWTAKYGVHIDDTVSYQHYQNGVAERNNRTVANTTNSLILPANYNHIIIRALEGRQREILANTSLPETLWPYAMRHAVWAKNRLPTRANKDRLTPWKMLKDQMPDVTHEKTWGSRVYLTRPHELRLRIRQPKLSPKADPGHFIGFESEAILYVYNVVTKKVVRCGTDIRVAEREGLQYAHDEPSLEDRLPDWNIPSQDHISTNDEDGDADNESDDGDGTNGEFIDDAASDRVSYYEAADDDNVPDGGDQQFDDGPDPLDPVEPLHQDETAGLYGMDSLSISNDDAPTDALDQQSNQAESEATSDEEARQQAAWEITDTAYGFNDYGSDTYHVAMLADKVTRFTAREEWGQRQRATPTRNLDVCCNECNKACTSAGSVVTEKGLLCLACASTIPDPKVCPKCLLSYNLYIHSRIGKICQKCSIKLHAEDDCDLEKCAWCSKLVKRTYPTPHGDYCFGCARKIPNPSVCPVCGKGASKWHHSSEGKICAPCYKSAQRKVEGRSSECNECYHMGHECDLKIPCSSCASRGKRCFGLQKKNGKPPQRYIDKCYDCARRGIICSGEKPCGSFLCKKWAGKCRYWKDGDWETPNPCVSCQKAEGPGFSCDGERPCQKCKKDGLNWCCEIDIPNIALRCFPTTEKGLETIKCATEKCRSCVAESKDFHCSGRDGYKPCIHCIRRKKNILYCSWGEGEVLVKIPTKP